jgi:hypothetical protein
MRIKSQFGILPVLVASLALTSCGGSHADTSAVSPVAAAPATPTSVINANATKGQQLLDLKKSLDAGEVSQSVYESQRAVILAAPVSHNTTQEHEAADLWAASAAGAMSSDEYHAQMAKLYGGS